MTSLAERLARPEILALAPFDIAAQFNWAYGPDAIKLDANENPYPPLVDGAIAAAVNRYPEPQPAKLKSAMAALYGVEPQNLVVTRGADDAIDILVRTFCRPGVDAVAIPKPTFSAYAHFVNLQGARIVEIPLDSNFDFDADAFIAEAKKEASLKLAFICSPNNPTGNEIEPALLLKVADSLADTIVVVDEAYGDFGSMPSPRNFASSAAGSSTSRKR
jgi:histidinol-phosphate/aromatic aminotransferase/cobyric acid decarboxylase-like protein